MTLPPIDPLLKRQIVIAACMVLTVCIPLLAFLRISRKARERREQP